MRPIHLPLTALAATVLLLASGCSKSPLDEEAAASGEAAAPTTSNADTAAVRADANETFVPGIGGAVAPGVAFAYRYAFTLPAKAIAGVQQEHAAACERLGPSRCRVTGMQFEQPREDEVSARIDFLLAPDIAHRFGVEGIAAVEKADGKVDNAYVSGENAGGEIALSQQNSAALLAEAERIEARLKQPGLSKDERLDLQNRAESMREQLRGQERLRRDKEASIATTPVNFAYASEGLLASGNGFGKAANASWGSLQSMTAALLVLLGLALPWLLPVAALVMFLRFRKAKRLLSGSTAGSPAPAVPAEPAAS